MKKNSNVLVLTLAVVVIMSFCLPALAQAGSLDLTTNFKPVVGNQVGGWRVGTLLCS
jgi:hypothetical protein